MFYPLTFLAAGLPFSVDFSCDFPGTNDYLSRTHTLSNRQIWTCAFWAERDATSALEYILSTNAAGPDAGIIFPSTNTFGFYNWNGTSYQIRESGGNSNTVTWNHWCVRVDTTSGTAANRVRLYKNGSLISPTEFNTQPSQNFLTLIGLTGNHEIGRFSEDGTGDFNGRLTEFCMVDGQSLDPNGTFYSGGSPISPVVSDWGSGGFYLRFDNAGNLGEDSSGNGNDWTVNGGLTRSTDVPPS